MTKSKLPDFSGKIVLFYMTNAPGGLQDGVLMEYISFVEYGDKLFLTGRIPTFDERGQDWVSNLQAGIAWNDVVHYVIFESRDDYISRTMTENVPLFKRLFG
jgi:hypothetical protein